jgi:hypothetical protein
MSWKRDENGQLVMDDSGNPVRVGTDGKEYAFSDDVLDSTLQNLETANAEAAKRKQKLRDLEGKLKPIEDIEDLQKWRKEADEAMKTVQNLKDEDLIKSSEVENFKKQLTDSYEQKIQELQGQLEKTAGKLREKSISAQFAQSSMFVGEDKKTAFTPRVAEKYFGSNFHLDEETGDPIPYDNQGNKILSRKNPGNTASFDEAIEILIEQDPDRDSILRGPKPGGGTPPGGGPGPSRDTAMSRQDFIKEQFANAR